MNKESNKKTTKSNNHDDVIYKCLKTMIIKLQVRPNEHLNIASLSAQFGKSITPVRAALKLLEYEELVRSVPKQGYFVSPINEKQVRDNIAIRCSLEILALETAIYRIDRSTLEKMIEQMQFTLEQKKEDRINEPIYTLDYSLHELIVANCDNQKLKSMYDSLVGFIDRSRNVIKYYNTPPGEVWINKEIDEHIEIAKCMLVGDLDGSRVRLKAHIEEIIESICEKLSNTNKQIMGLWS